MVECYNREVQGLDDVEIWIHTCWGNPNMQRVMEDTSYKRVVRALPQRAARRRLDDRDARTATSRDIELFGQYKGKLPKKICIGAVSHRTLQADRAEDVAAIDPARARAHRARAADRVERLRLRPPGLQPRDRVLQGQRHRAGLQHRPPGARPGERAMCRRRIRRCRSTSCRRRRRSDGPRQASGLGTRDSGSSQRFESPIPGAWSPKPEA